MLLTTRKAATRFPAVDFAQILELRGKLKALLEAKPSPDVSLAAAVAMNAWQDGAVLRAAPGYEAEDVLLRELEKAGHLGASGAVTAIGAAACELRTFAQPHRALDAVLDLGRTEGPVKFLCLVSLLLADGGRDEDGGDSGCLGAAEATLRARQACSSPRLVRSVLTWAEGGKLFDVVGLGVPVGHFCRHVLRVSDAVRELDQAFGAMGAELDAAGPALQLIERGLPFAHRGAAA